MSSHLEQLKAFFERDVSLRATAPLKDGIQVSIKVGDQTPVTLTKLRGKPVVDAIESEQPDLTFTVPEAALDRLVETQTEDIGEIGLAILKLMADSDPKVRVTAKVHIGFLSLLGKGYLSVLPLGGATVMKFLASKGMGGMGKIKETISRMKE